MTEPVLKKSANFDLSSLDLLDLSDAPFYESGPARELDGEKFIVFFLGTDAYAIQCGKVAEIFQPLDITPLPTTPDWLVGIANFRNEIISVIDLQLVLKKQASSQSAKSKLIVLRPDGSEAPVALLIDKLSEMMTVTDESIERFGDRDSPFIYGKTSYQLNTLYLLDSPGLLASLSF